MIQQSLLPTKWIIVNDGSTDSTAEIVERYAAKYPWIKLIHKSDRGNRAVGPGVVETFYFGFDTEDVQSYDFICKLDGDIEFENDYFKNLVSKFDSDKKLGAASGKPFITLNGRKIIERTHDEMVAGQINFYKLPCFNAIGGFVREVHWDAIAFHRARMEGWKTASFRDDSLMFHHLRVMGSSDRGVLTGRLRWGKGQYFLGTHPLYLLAIGVYRAFEHPMFIGGLLIVAGYIRSWIRNDVRFQHPGFKESLHAWQFERLGIGKRVEEIN